MSDWLRWPRLWYATPTFVFFIALQAPDWRFTGRVRVALVVWATMGVAIDVWMTRHQGQPAVASRKKDINRQFNAAMIFGLVLAFCGFVFRPAPHGIGHGSFAAALNVALEWLGLVLPVLDVFHHDLLETGRFDYAAYLGGFFLLIVVTWLLSFVLFYRTFTRLSSAEFAKTVAANRNYGAPPYVRRHRMQARAGLILVPVFVSAMLLLFARVLPMDASDVHPSQAYLVLGWAGPLINILIYGFHSSRRFLASMQPNGFLPAGESDQGERL